MVIPFYYSSYYFTHRPPQRPAESIFGFCFLLRIVWPIRRQLIVSHTLINTNFLFKSHMTSIIKIHRHAILCGFVRYLRIRSFWISFQRRKKNQIKEEECRSSKRSAEDSLNGNLLYCRAFVWNTMIVRQYQTKRICRWATTKPYNIYVCVCVCVYLFEIFPKIRIHCRQQ